MNWLYYLAEANLYLGVFYLAYCLLLNKETYYQLNRVYLLASCILSFILPVMQVGLLKPVEFVQVSTFNYQLPLDITPQLPVTATVVHAVTEHQLSVADYLWYGYFIGAAVLLIALLVKLIALLKLIRSDRQVNKGSYKLIQLPQSDAAFSFFNYLFIGKDADVADTIIRHELVHIRQRHSADIIFMELLKIINWFNPFIYLLQNSLKTVHEYIADEQTAAHETDPIIYSTFLLNNAYGTGGSSVTHSFFNYNLLKRRIIMLNQKRSGGLAKLRYLVALPICAASLCASTLAFSKDYGWIDIAPANAIAQENPPAPELLTAKNQNAETSQSNLQQPQQPVKFPPPSVFKPGFGRLMGHLQHSVIYTDELKNEKNTYVGVSFNVGANRKISDIQLFKPAGNGFDDLAKAAFESFDGVVTAKPGKHTFMLNYFSDKGPVDPEYLQSKYDVNLVIVAPKPGEVKATFPPPTPPKVKRSAIRVLNKNNGYVSKGRLNNGAVPIQTIAPKDTKALFIVDGKKYEFTPETLAKYNAKSLLYMSCDEMTVYEQGNAYAEKTWGKYGKVVVLTGNASIRIVEFPFGKEDAKATPSASPIEPQPIDQSKLITREFVNYLQENIKFPKYPLDDNFVVTLNANFTVTNNKITNIDLTRAEDRLAYVNKPDIKISEETLNTFRAEVLKVMQTAPIDNIAPGKYQVPVAFLYKKGKELFDVLGIMMTKTAKGTLAGVYPPIIKPV